jgi:hypothetical protein
VLESGNARETVEGGGWHGLPARLRRRLRFGRHADRGDLYVTAERID